MVEDGKEYRGDEEDNEKQDVEEEKKMIRSKKLL